MSESVSGSLIESEPDKNNKGKKVKPHPKKKGKSDREDDGETEKKIDDDANKAEGEDAAGQEYAGEVEEEKRIQVLKEIILVRE
jgi:hypothetical protein